MIQVVIENGEKYEKKILKNFRTPCMVYKKGANQKNNVCFLKEDIKSLLGFPVRE